MRKTVKVVIDNRSYRDQIQKGIIIMTYINSIVGLERISLVDAFETQYDLQPFNIINND